MLGRLFSLAATPPGYNIEAGRYPYKLVGFPFKVDSSFLPSYWFNLNNNSLISHGIEREI